MIFTDYLRFLVQSIHLHGVHSPFVFDLITNCLRLKNQKTIVPINQLPQTGILPKQFSLLLQIIQYFEVKNMLIDDKNLQKILNSVFKNIQIESNFDLEMKTKKYDLIFLKNSLKTICPTSFLTCMHNDSVLIINDIHLKTNKPHWRKIVQHCQTTACVDTFYQGYAFIRKQQKKELFFVKV